MATILASKFFKSSTRKARILQAVADPINMELVTQLKDSVNWEDIPTDVLNDYVDNHMNDDATAEDDGWVEFEDKSSSDKSSSSAPRHTSAPAAPLPGFDDDEDFVDFEDDTSESPAGELDEGQPADTADDDTEPDDGLDIPVGVERELQESRKAEGSTIEGSTALYPYNKGWTYEEYVQHLPLDVVKGTLNSRQDTAGVSRVELKKNELWIYYDDSSNLNNILDKAIDVVTYQLLPDLHFNRLARSNNAIVFDIQISTFQEPEEKQ